MGFHNCNDCYEQWTCKDIPCYDENRNLCSICMDYWQLILKEALQKSFNEYQTKLFFIYDLQKSRSVL